ncbi:MAG: Spy/CpxP family protein refolding chaperone [Rhodocyclaceae bacterium]
MSRRKSVVTAALITTLVAGLASGAASAYRGGHGGDGFGHGMGEGHGIERMVDWLDLSASQRTSVRAIEDKYRPQLRTLRDQLADSRKALRDLSTQAKPDEPKVRTLADAQGKAMSDLIVLRTRMFGEMQQLLTEAQRAKLRDFRERGPMPRRG